MIEIQNEELKELIEKSEYMFRDVVLRKKLKPIYDQALLIAQEDNNTVLEYYIKGKMALMDNNNEKARETFQKAREINPEFLEAWHYEGLSLYNLELYNEAIFKYENAITIDKNYAWSYNNLGTAYYKLERYVEAITYYDKTIDIDPEYAGAAAYYNKGLAYHKLGEYTLAIESYDKALEQDPNYWNALNRKGLAYHYLGKYTKAIEFYDKALNIDPENKMIQDNKKYTQIILSTEEEVEKVKLLNLPAEEEEERIIEINVLKESIIKLIDKIDPILKEKKKYENELEKLLIRTEKADESDFLLILRRWNSYTPAMLTNTDFNFGGGYFLNWNGKGIVIDPGFDFLDNFFNKSFTIQDIDAIVITHAHIDHCNDFESIITLLYEYNDSYNKKIEKIEERLNKNDSISKSESNKLEKEMKKLNLKKKKIDIFMNLGTMKKVLGWLPINDSDDLTFINRIYPLEKGVEYKLKDYNMKIKATGAIHNEILSTKYSVGLILTLDYDKDPIKIGFTSDTSYNAKIANQYKNINLIIPHLGSIEKNDFFDLSTIHKNHLMLKGVVPIINKSNADLAIISEFGEELGQCRIEIVSAIDEIFYNKKRIGKKTKCIAGDIGLMVKLPELKVRCHFCGFVDPEKIWQCAGMDEEDDKSIIYFCEDCKPIYEYTKGIK